MLFKKGNRQGKRKFDYFINARILSRNEKKDNELDIRPCARVFFSFEWEEPSILK